MSSENNVDSIFSAAIAFEEQKERDAFLEKACGEDLDQRERVEELLRAHDQAGRFMHDTETADPTQDFVGSEREGSVIGPYKLLQELGKGGMGVVYMAEQTQPVKRRVALKIIKPGMDSTQVIARFEAERQALAMMDHPSIAKVLDAGTTGNGRPYFVMELVKGVPITQYCDENRIAPKQRLEMFIQVCKAVQHAHQKGIIHRDLKPQNILVTDYDHKAVPKVIDFGIAKATSQTLTDKTLFTQVGQIVGTFEYMSPEQAKMNQLDVDTRSDIYSLGVILYELLTGVTPHERIRQAGLEEILRVIREDEPPKPSTRISKSTKSATTLPTTHRTSIQNLHRFVQGDLDWIVMKSLDKDRVRRYDSATNFADDIQRYLSNEPIAARPPSITYKLRKYIHRNKAVLATAALVFVAFAGTLIGSAWKSARDAANESRDHMLVVPTNGLTAALSNLDEHMSWAEADLVALAEQPPENEEDRLNALRARLALVNDTDETHVSKLVDAMLSESPHYVAAILDRLQGHSEKVTATLWNVFHDSRSTTAKRLRAGIALAKYDDKSEAWRSEDYEFLAQKAVRQSPADQAVWLHLLEPISQRCLKHWEEMFSESTSIDQVNVAYALEFYAQIEPLEQERIADLLAKANPQQFDILLPLVNADASVDLSEKLHRIATKIPPPQMETKDRIVHGRNRAGAGITLLRLGQLLPALDALMPQDDPEVIAQFIHMCSNRGVTAAELLDCLNYVHDSDTGSEDDGIKLYALLLALAEYSPEDLAQESQRALVDQLANWYATDKRSIVHGATGWILRQWGETDLVSKVDQSPVSYSRDSEWFTKKIEIADGDYSYFTFVVIEPGKSVIGSPEDEPMRFQNEHRHEIEVSRRYAIADREITRHEIKAFGAETGIETKKEFASMKDGWAGPGLTWYDSIQFCRWLARRDGLSEENQAYPAPASLNSSEFPPVAEVAGSPPGNWPLRLDREGFRLPTEAEWEVAARAGARTSFCFGSDEELLKEYGWMGLNSNREPHEPKTLKPSMRGLFDIHGNMFEWCHDWRGPYDTDQLVVDGIGPQNGDFRVLRGGCWGIVPDFCRVSARLGHVPTTPFPFIGFRIAMTLPEDEDQRQTADTDQPLVALTPTSNREK